MNILHISDTHGLFFPLPRPELYDCIVHSGDFAPNRPRRPVGELIQPRREYLFQLDWYGRRMATLKEWIGDKPFLFLPGNHDFYSPIDAMRAAGIVALSLLLPSHVQGLRFVGMPFIPWCGGEWSREASEDEIAGHMPSNDEPDVLVTHSPPRDILDLAEDGTRIGSTAIARYLGEGPEGVEKPAHKLPQLLLCGHVHRSAGTQTSRWGTVVSNAACTSRILHVENPS